MPRTILVGVTHRQPDAVLQRAAELARALDASLVCAWVDASLYPIEERDDGSVRAASYDADVPDVRDAALGDALRAHIARVLDPTLVAWEAQALAGDPARALGALAATLEASLIVVGVREDGWLGNLQELVGGSVAVHLAHRQHRPVVVVPVDPVGLDGRTTRESEA